MQESGQAILIPLSIPPAVCFWVQRNLLHLWENRAQPILLPDNPEVPYGFQNYTRSADGTGILQTAADLLRQG